MEDSQRMCRFPFYCGDCQSLVQLNAFNQARCCANCHGTDLLPYDDESLSGPGEGEVFKQATEYKIGRDLKLTDGPYLCPACGEKNLRFRMTGLWD